MQAIAPDHPETWLQIGLISDAAGDYPRALAAYRRAVELAPEHSNAVLNLGVCERRAGNAAEAERLFLRASALSARSAPPYACYAAVLIDQDRVEQALPAARKAVALDPDLVFGQRVLARTLMLHGDAAEALVALQAVVRLEPATELTHRFAREMLEKIATPADVAAEDERYRRMQDAAGRR
jgi:protein O-GlcNAc transferase